MIQRKNYIINEYDIFEYEAFEQKYNVVYRMDKSATKFRSKSFLNHWYKLNRKKCEIKQYITKEEVLEFVKIKQFNTNFENLLNE